MKTLIAIILDESGSMHSKKADTIGGYNSFLEEQRKLKDDEARFYLIKFNSVVTVVHNDLPLNDVPLMDESTYTPGGCTALYDAIAEGVKLMEKNK
ncbi:VWA domain-containing protein-like protein, partial [Dinothrombium tinctorium]